MVVFVRGAEQAGEEIDEPLGSGGQRVADPLEDANVRTLGYGGRHEIGFSESARRVPSPGEILRQLAV